MFRKFLKYISQSISGMIGVSIYILADTFFISYKCGADGLAALNLILPVFGLVFAIGSMIGIGSATRYNISTAKGSPSDYYFTQSIFWCLICSIPFMLTGIFIPHKALALLGADAGLIRLGRNYMRIVLLFTPFFMSNYTFTAFARNDHATSIAMIGSISGSFFNILFDYILICIFHMGMQGAAFATIGGQFLSALWQLAFLFGKRTIIPLNATLLKLQLNISKQIIQTGIPAFLMQISNSVLNIILNASFVKYGGDLALSAIGIVTSIQTLILMPITGLMQGQQPLISYNYGALKMERVKETLKYAIIGATMIALIGFIAVQFFTKSIVYMFNDEADVVKLCSHALHIWFMCLPLIGAQVMCANYFQAIGKIKISSVLNLLRQIIILIPCIIIFSSIIGLDGIFIAVPVADLSAFIITVLLLKNALKKEA